ncbi:MAG TPA: helix-turn-helix transcriptional regulator [Streptosporangiaceae bacterium]|nr:helix-turn-helix transcriptional regulator [Streptosporangiaceae bacterium]
MPGQAQQAREALGARLRAVRLDAGLTARALAQLAGWHFTKVSKLEHGTATVYHCRPHADLVDPGLPKMRMSPAAMFEHGLARAGYIEAPRDPHPAYEFLATRWRTIQHYGVEIGA